jgi:dephospho-CoA kinase
MKLFGITGGVGMGKSTTGALLAKRGMATVDTDVIARQLVEPGQPALAEIARAFGPSVLAPEGILDRKELARRVFGDPAERAKLEAILHPKIREAWAAEVERWRASGCDCGAVIIPLLFETKAESLFDAVICVACGAASQIERLRQRGWSRAEIRQRLEAQWPAEEKINRADFVIWTDTTLEAHAAQLDKVLSRMAPVASSVPGGPTSSAASGAPA